MKIYKVNFTSKEAKKEFTNLYERFMDNDENTGEIYDIKGKKKSVVIEAKNKKAVRKSIGELERYSTGPYYDNGYCFGVEDEDYSIKKVDIDDYELE